MSSSPREIGDPSRPRQPCCGETNEGTHRCAGVQVLAYRPVWSFLTSSWVLASEGTPKAPANAHICPTCLPISVPYLPANARRQGPLLAGCGALD